MQGGPADSGYLSPVHAPQDVDQRICRCIRQCEGMESQQVRGHPLFVVESGLYEGGTQQKPSQPNGAHPCGGHLTSPRSDFVGEGDNDNMLSMQGLQIPMHIHPEVI